LKHPIAYRMERKDKKVLMQEKQNIAVFVDYDNIEIGVKSTLRREFDVSIVLDALKERGDLVAKFAYANWGRQEHAARLMAESAVQMVQRLPSPRGDKNGGDINLALDALEMAFTHSHVNAFAIVSGDSDFIPLVNKLKEYGKVVYVVGGKAFTSTILQQNCHEFISYEGLLMGHPRGAEVPAAEPPREGQAGPSGLQRNDGMTRSERRRERERERREKRDRERAERIAAREAREAAAASGQPLPEGVAPAEGEGAPAGAPPPPREWKDRPAPLELPLAMPLVERALQVLERRGVQPQLGLLKSTMLQLDSSFNERSYGSSSFSDFIDKLKKAELVNVSGSGGRFIIERKGPARPLPEPEDSLPVLRDVLEDHRLEMEEGQTVEQLIEWVKDYRADFEPANYGFQGFNELFNYAQDKSVLRIERKTDGTTVSLGAEFYPPALPPEPEPEEYEEEDDGPQPYVEGQPTIHDPNPVAPKAKPVKRASRKARVAAVVARVRAARRRSRAAVAAAEAVPGSVASSLETIKTPSNGPGSSTLLGLHRQHHRWRLSPNSTARGYFWNGFSSALGP
jgi:uncharacterized protein (TIGR00288 family)